MVNSLARSLRRVKVKTSSRAKAHTRQHPQPKANRLIYKRTKKRQ